MHVANSSSETGCCFCLTNSECYLAEDQIKFAKVFKLIPRHKNIINFIKGMMSFNACHKATINCNISDMLYTSTILDRRRVFYSQND